MIDRFAPMRRWIGRGALRSSEFVGPDGLHLTDRGCALRARAVFETLAMRVPGIRLRMAGVRPAG